MNPQPIETDKIKAATREVPSSRGYGSMLKWVFLWYGFSTLLSLFNKFLIGKGPEYLNFGFPLTITAFHFFSQYIFSSVILWLFLPNLKPKHELTWHTYSRLLFFPALATSLDIGCSNFSLMFVTLSFYTMCKSTTPIFLLSFAFLFGIEQISYRLMLVVMLMCSGLILTVYGETMFDWRGFLLIMLGSLMSGLRWTLVQVLLQSPQAGIDNPLAVMYTISPTMVLILGSIAFVVEKSWLMFESSPISSFTDIGSTLLFGLVGSFLAFAMILSEFYLIRETSALILAAAGVCKELITILVSHLVFRDRLGPVNLMGLIVVTMGLALFQYHKINHSAHRRQSIPEVE